MCASAIKSKPTKVEKHCFPCIMTVVRGLHFGSSVITIIRFQCDRCNHVLLRTLSKASNQAILISRIRNTTTRFANSTSTIRKLAISSHMKNFTPLNSSYATFMDAVLNHRILLCHDRCW